MVGMDCTDNFVQVCGAYVEQKYSIKKRHCGLVARGIGLGLIGVFAYILRDFG
jgi:hypothetical protein